MLWGHPQTTRPLQIQYKGEKHPCSNIFFHAKILFQYKSWFIKLKDINTYSLYCCYCCSSRQYFDRPSFSKDRWQAKSCQHFPQIPQNHTFKRIQLLSVQIFYLYNLQKKIPFHLICDIIQLKLLVLNFSFSWKGFLTVFDVVTL